MFTTPTPFPLTLAPSPGVTGAPVPCPPPPPDSSTPTPETLAYSLTLPAALATPALARTCARALLQAHGLEDLTAPAVQAIGELTATACRFTTHSTEIYLSLRYRDDALRITVYDDHPTHTNPRLADHCQARRRSQLRLLGCLVRTCAGNWGYAPAPPPTTGTRMWATLPHTPTYTAA
ncbi:ATP-binding protein [Streptomyces apocyni]|uniref:ATP-binding protein n=1 Tax=Streptomyces apocyni TaxID=2654677 RepID=UPI002D7E27F3|nr:ATP-binding protein [Streptomyces apocyni]